MEQSDLIALLSHVADHSLSCSDALQKLKELPFSDLGFAKVDHHRSVRTGTPEVIFCQGKTKEHICAIVDNQLAHNETVFGTRASAEVLETMRSKYPLMTVDVLGRCFYCKSSAWTKKDNTHGTILIATAGTSDMPVAQEAACTLSVMGNSYEVLSDVGVAGIHRLFAHKDILAKASVIIVIAGMEGALPSVIAGLVSCPVIGVPTSIGYGSHLNGLVPLFAMLNSCASGLSVVNIDNGFGAARTAVAINTPKTLV